MGQVFKAVDTRLNRIVAIKQLNGQHTGRFEQEARAIGALNHPNICTLYDVGPDYLVMEYIEGAPLRGPMAADEAVRIASQIAGALEAAHVKGILHRDLKPANVIVSGGLVKLLDFGLAKLISNAPTDVTKTVEGTALGTVAYMSPEQAQGRPVDERSDVFSFGAVVYELLSGTRAFPGDSTADVVSAVMRDNPRLPAASGELGRIVARCLSKAPGDRFQRMSDVKTALEQLSQATAEQPASIAVLPFADMSPGKDHEYFSDGLAEEIIDSLARIPGLKVIARTSAFAFKGQSLDVRQIAATLGVGHILEGSVRKAGNRIRVSVQLIAASDGSHLWSERFDRDLADIFAVQEEIALAIAGALKAKLGTSAMPSRQYTPNLAAYEAFLKGRHHLWKITPESLALSGQYFSQAIAADPMFGLACSGLSHHYFFLAMFSLMPAHKAMPLMRTHALRALELDPKLPDAHALLGVVAALYDYDWTEARRRFDLAMGRQPISPWTRNMFGLFYLLYAGRPAEAVVEITLALEDDPLALSLRYALGACLLAAGRGAEGSAHLQRVIELDEKFMTAYGIQTIAYLEEGNLDAALDRAEHGFALGAWDPVTVGLLAGVQQRRGDTDRAAELLARLGDGTAFGAPVGFMVFNLVCGNIDKAGDWIERAAEQRYPGILFFVHLPLGSALRASSRWPAVATLMNLPESAR
jgi:serine/threonine-protein kinase